MSRVSRIGLPLSRVSTTASSRERSATRRAMRNRYLPRSAGAIGPHTRVCARRAAATAAATSAGPPWATVDSRSSVAGLTVWRVRPSAASTNAPSTNSP